MAATTGFSSEKAGYNLNQNGQEVLSGDNVDSGLAGKRRNSVNEAAELYGDVETSAEFGYVERQLKSRHIQFIALGGTIGTGLFVGIGAALYESGPLSILLGYTIMGFFI